MPSSLAGKVIVNVLFGGGRDIFCSRNSLSAGFFILNEAGTDVVGFYNTVFMQRGKAGGKRGRKNFCAVRPGVNGKTGFFPRNDRPYGLQRTAFQSENAPDGMKKGNAFKRHCLKGVTFVVR